MTVRPSQTTIQDVTEGIRDGFTLILLYLPLALAYAIMAQAAGLNSLEIVLWSVLVFAGMSQLASLSILMLGGGFPEVMVTTLLVNLRHAFVSLSLAPYLRGVSRKVLPLIGFGVVTTSAGLIPAKAKRAGSVKVYMLSTQFCQYGQWVLFTLCGIYLGQIIPSAWERIISFAAPAAFIGLIMLLLADRPKTGAIVVLVAGAIGVGLGLVIAPHLSVIIAAVIAACVGLLIRDRIC